MGDTDALIANDGVCVLYDPCLITEADGTFTPPVDGELHFIVGNGHSYWKSKSITIGVRDNDRGQARYPTEPFASMYNANSEAWDLAMYGLVGKVALGRMQWDARRDERGRFLFTVPRGRVARSIVSVEAGVAVIWNVDVEEHDARLSVVFKIAQDTLMALVAAKTAPKNVSVAVATDPTDEQQLSVEIHTLRRTLSSAKSNIKELSNKLHHQSVTLDRHKDDLKKANVALTQSMERTLVAETARSRLRNEMSRLREREHELQISLNQVMVKMTTVDESSEARDCKTTLVTSSDTEGDNSQPVDDLVGERNVDNEPTLVDTRTNKPMRCPKTTSGELRPKPPSFVKRKTRSCCW